MVVENWSLPYHPHHNWATICSASSVFSVFQLGMKHFKVELSMMKGIPKT